MEERRSDIAGHQILDLIGRGGMGEVFRARRWSDGRVVALKVIQPELARNPEYRQRFTRESKIAASISDPHVVEIFESGSDNGTLFLSMELIDGSDLQRLIDLSGKLSPHRALAILKDAASGLDSIHAAGLVHRDIKPANVLISSSEQPRAYLTDFGIAKAAAGATALTSAGHFVGTFDYNAPEQIEGGAIDARADIYSLGCVVYHALTGTPPFPGDTPSAKLWAHVHHEPPDISTSQTGDLALLVDVFKRVLAKDPEDRFRSAGDLAASFEAALEGRAVTRVERVVGTGDAQEIKTQVMPHSRWRHPRRRWLLGIAGAAIACLVLATVLFALSDRSGESSGPGNRAEAEKTPVTDSNSDANAQNGSGGSAAAQKRTYWMLGDANDPEKAKSVVEPREMFVVGGQCSGCGKRIVNLKWSDWGGPEARGSGRAVPIGGPGTCGWPPEGCTYPYESAEVVLSNVSTRCGESRYMTAQASVDGGDMYGWPSVNCAGQFTLASPVSTEGIGPMLVGMSMKEIEAATGVFGFSSESYGNPTCRISSSTLIPDVVLYFDHGGLVRIDTRNLDSQTLSGVGIGDLQERVYEVYGDQISQNTDESGEYLTYTPTDAKDNTRVVFDIDGGRVSYIRAGQLPEVTAYEVCV